MSTCRSTPAGIRGRRRSIVVNDETQNLMVAGVDGSLALTAALWAAAAAQRRGAAVRLVNAFSISPVFSGPGALFPNSVPQLLTPRRTFRRTLAP